MRAWTPETVGSGIASEAVAAPPVAGTGRLAGAAADVERQLLHRHDARLAQGGERVAGADHDDDADVRHLAGQAPAGNGSTDIVFVAGGHRRGGEDGACAGPTYTSTGDPVGGQRGRAEP